MVCVCLRWNTLSKYIPLYSHMLSVSIERRGGRLISKRQQGKGVGHGARQGGKEVESLWEVAMWLWAVWPSGWRLRAVSPHLTVLCVCFSSSWLMACVSLTFYGLCVLKWTKWQLLVGKEGRTRQMYVFRRRKKITTHSYISCCFRVNVRMI